MTSLAAVLPALGRSLARARGVVDGGTLGAIAESLTVLAEREAGRKFIRALEQALAPVERGFANRLVERFARLGQHVAQVAEDAGGLLLEAEEPPQPARERVERILAAAALRDWAGRQLRPVYEQRYLQVAETVVETVNTEIKLGLMLPDPVANKVVAEGGRRLGLLDLADDSRQALYRVIAQAREQGIGAKAIGRLIRDKVPAGRFVNAGSRYRAELVARTEVLHSSRYSSLEIYRAAENIRAVRMHDNLGGFGDADCLSRDGQVVSFEDAEVEMAREHVSGTLGFSPVSGALV